MNDDMAEWELIHAYSRADALANGDLIDCTALADEAGFKHPTAITRAAWADAVAWSAGNKEHQDETGRLWDVLNAARHEIMWRKIAGKSAGDRLMFSLNRIPNTPNATRLRKTTLLYHVGPGDDPSPVITIMCPDET